MNTRSERRPGSRPVAALLTLLALAGCGRGASEASSVRDAAGATSTSSTTAVVAIEEPTTTIAAPEPPPAQEPAPRTVVPPTTTTTVKPVARPSTTSTSTTVQVVSPPVSLVEPPLQPPGQVVASHGGPVRDHVSLVDNLRGRGLTVVPESAIHQPFLRGDGTSLAISGPGITATRLQSFQYETAEAAASDAATFGADGNPRGVMVDWVAPPHLYLRGRVLAIYLGTDAAVLRLLTDLLGPQFAGR